MDYEKLYKEAFERARAKYAMKDQPIHQDLADIFPELAESEEEKTKRMLHTIANKMSQHLRDIFTEEEFQCFDAWSNAWLEKQGEHAKFIDSIQVGDKVTRNQDGMLVNLSQLNRVAKKDEKQGKQRSAEWSDNDEWCLEQINFLIRNSYSVDDKVERLSNWVKSIKDRLLPQLKKEWSEEDEDNLTDIFVAIDNFHTTNHKKELITFLKSLKDKVQPQSNQKWSEEDEKKRTLLISILEVNHPNGYFKVNPANTLNMESMHTEELVDWLKSLRPQNRWKPSIAQLNALSIVSKGCAPDDIEEIKSLYADLKKLMEE